MQCCVTNDESNEIVIVVRDPGTGFDPSKVPNPLAEENLLKSSGRGIFLINELMDEVSFADGGRGVVGPHAAASPFRSRDRTLSAKVAMMIDAMTTTML